MGYKKIAHKSKESRFKKCTACGRKFIQEPGDEDVCGECVERLLQPCKPSPITEVA